MQKKRRICGWFVSSLLVVAALTMTLSAGAMQGFPDAFAANSHHDKGNLHSHAASQFHPRLPRWNPLLLGTRRVYTYEHVGSYSGTLYLFKPKAPSSTPLPVVVYFHGGGLIHGTAVIGVGPKYTKEWVVASLEKSLIRRGFAFASVNYRLAPKFEWPAQIDDSKAAVRFLTAHAKQLGLNPTEMSVIGDSAGGALASLVGLTGSDSSYHDVFTVGPWRRSQSNVRAVVDLFGPVDRRWKADEWTRRFGSKPNPVFGPFSPSLVRSASAVSYVHSGAPPFLIVQGLKDPIDPPWLSLELYHKLKSVGSPAHILLLKHASHEFIPVGGPVEPSVQVVIRRVSSFLDKYGKAERMPVHAL